VEALVDKSLLVVDLLKWFAVSLSLCVVDNNVLAEEKIDGRLFDRMIATGLNVQGAGSCISPLSLAVDPWS
jgi:hypothetical protein